MQRLINKGNIITTLILISIFTYFKVDMTNASNILLYFSLYLFVRLFIDKKHNLTAAEKTNKQQA